MSNKAFTMTAYRTFRAYFPGLSMFRRDAMYDVFLGSSNGSLPGRITTIPVYEVDRLVLLQFGH
ncbi:MAG: hypothetical protein BAJATHORv1_20569 [Candidatus Thorarchaeota archaeon]|nr:MAG: hypothetical protein BAJATHORv1_20569 [Candidatus Thorarchaeota archaeon]